DPRIAAAVPFNFGGPQPETQFPLPENAEDRFNYAGGGSWESTRNLRLSVRDGFLPWVIVGSLAPRRLVYAHEFAWDREHDPVWARLEAIFGQANARDHLAFTHGSGSVKGQPPESTHCNNIGAVHRRMMYPAFERWFGLPVPKEEYRNRRSSEELLCLSGANAPSNTSKTVHQLADELAAGQIAEARKTLAGKSHDERREALRARWTPLLGDIAPYRVQQAAQPENSKANGIRIEKHLLGGERDIRLPVLMLIPARPGSKRLPVVVAIAQEGKAGLLKHREELIAGLLDAGIAVCLPDLRGTGESRPGSDRGRGSEATTLSSLALMLGTPPVGEQLRDLRSVQRWLRTQSDFDPQHMAVHGDSFATRNGPEARLEVPLDLDQPHLADTSAALVAQLAGLFEDDLAAISAEGGLVSFRSLLASPFLHVPHDAVIPGATSAGDIADLARASRAVWLSGLVDGLNRPATGEAVSGAFAPGPNSQTQSVPADQTQLAAWLRERLK
ncbi:MAG TPA: hypothetical protein VHB77_07010, partial [Planctomycetaceae bacterium]|nr:hypothetical protein [Planctomycetaceae bacterium]